MRRIVGLFLAFLLCGCVLVFGQDKQEKKGVSKEALQAHLAALQQGRDQALANYNAILGAIQLCQDLLAELNAAEKADNTKAAAKADPPLAQAEKNSKPAEKPDSASSQQAETGEEGVADDALLGRVHDGEHRHSGRHGFRFRRELDAGRERHQGDQGVDQIASACA